MRFRVRDCAHLQRGGQHFFVVVSPLVKHSTAELGTVVDFDSVAATAREPQSFQYFF